MRILDLGPLQVEVDGTRKSCAGAKQAAILATLAMRANERVPLEDLVVAGWGYDATVAGSTVENHIWRLRQLLEPGRGRTGAESCLVNDTGGYRLTVAADALDSARFERLAERSRAALPDSPQDALRGCDEALALWRGRPYEIVEHATATAPAIARLEELRGQVLERRMDALLAAGELEPVVVDAEALVAEFPYRERLWAAKMTAQARLGRLDEALQTYQRIRVLLRDELGLEPGRELTELQRTVIARGEEPAPRPDAGRVREGLPAVVALPGRPGVLIGRDRELTDLARLVVERPVVTIVGPGGCGKTRLAVQVARHRSASFPDGVWFVDLTEVREAHLVVDLTVSRLGIAVEGTDARAALHAYLQNRRILLVVDNCEHVLDGVATLVEDLTDGGSLSAILATSREPIDVDAELVWTLGPLSLTPEAGRPSAAAELFLTRAPHHGEDEHALVERICAAVDGLPLAVELAAARTRTFTLAELLDQVGDDPSGLGRIGRGPADHRRTLRSAIDWSHELLTADEQVVHRRLSVLPGPFSLPLAAAVVGDAVDVAAIPTALTGLVHRSLLVSTPPAAGHGSSTFHQLETVRAHGRHRLRDTGEDGPTLARRDRWVRQLLAQRPRLGRPEEGAWYDLVDDTYATVRATLENVPAVAPDAALVRECSELAWYWFYRGRVHEGTAWLTRAIAHVGDGPGTVVPRFCLAAMLLLQGRVAEARPVVDGAVSDVDGVPDADGAALVQAMVGAAGAAWFVDAFDLCAAVHARTAPIAARLGDPDLDVVVAAVACATGLAVDPADRGAFAELADRASVVHARATELDNVCAAWMTRTVLFTVALIAGDPDAGLMWTDRAIDAVRRLGAGGVGMYVGMLANFLVMRGGPDDLDEAVRLYASAHARATRSGLTFPPPPLTSAFFDRARAAADPDRYGAAWEEGAQLTLDDIVARRADHRLDSVR